MMGKELSEAIKNASAELITQQEANQKSNKEYITISLSEYRNLSIIDEKYEMLLRFLEDEVDADTMTRISRIFIE